MNLKERNDTTYFDQTGKQILVGDLLKVYHFHSGNRTKYMYLVVVMAETQSFPVMALKAHYAIIPHCKMYALANNEQRVYKEAKIIAKKDWETKRIRIKIKTTNPPENISDVIEGIYCECGEEMFRFEIYNTSDGMHYCECGKMH